jgi:hypothetical protein
MEAMNPSQEAGKLAGELRAKLGDLWRDEWLADGLIVMSHEELASALTQGEAAFTNNFHRRKGKARYLCEPHYRPVMPAWLTALFAALWELVKPWVVPAGAAVLGSELQKGQEAQNTLDKIHEANEAATVTRGWSRADRLRYFDQPRRRRYAPFIEPTISDFMLEQLTQLDVAMEAACR